MNDVRKIFGGGAHFDENGAFSDEFASAVADHADAENAVGIWLEDQLGDAIGAVKSKRAAGSSPRKLHDVYLDIFRFGFGFSETGPGDFRIGEDDGGNDRRV